MHATDFMDGDLKSQVLSAYPLCERKAILVHKYFLGIEMGFDPGPARAVESWELHFASAWRRQKQVEDINAQINEIERHKWLLSQKCGHDAGWEASARDWICHYAQDWRHCRESQAVETT